MTNEETREMIDDILDAYDVCQLEVNDWEEEFLNNVMNNETWTDKQKKVINRIYEGIG